MQRRAVLFPEPLRPMMATTSPRDTSISMPRSTSLLPKRLRTPFRLTTVSGACVDVSVVSSIGIGSRPGFQPSAQYREWIAHAEIKRCDQQIDDKRLEDRVVDDLARADEFDEPHD